MTKVIKIPYSWRRVIKKLFIFTWACPYQIDSSSAKSRSLHSLLISCIVLNELLVFRWSHISDIKMHKWIRTNGLFEAWSLYCGSIIFSFQFSLVLQYVNIKIGATLNFKEDEIIRFKTVTVVVCFFQIFGGFFFKAMKLVSAFIFLKSGFHIWTFKGCSFVFVMIWCNHSSSVGGYKFMLHSELWTITQRYIQRQYWGSEWPCCNPLSTTK